MRYKNALVKEVHNDFKDSVPEGINSNKRSTAFSQTSKETSKEIETYAYGENKIMKIIKMSN